MVVSVLVPFVSCVDGARVRRVLIVLSDYSKNIFKLPNTCFQTVTRMLLLCHLYGFWTEYD